METLIQSPVSFSEEAMTELNRLMNEPGFDTAMKLRVGVKGGGCSGMSYVLAFDQVGEKDRPYRFQDLEFVMDPSHEIYLFGMEVDWQDGLNSRGFTFQNPNASSTCGCGTSFAV